MEVKFTPAEREHLAHVNTLHAERKREYLLLDSIREGLLLMLQKSHSCVDAHATLLPDGSGFVVQETKQPLETGGT